MDNADITVVVQGPVQSLPERPQDEGITRRCLTSVRRFLPGARIILSTWENQDLDGLDFDELVINEDPGPNVIGYDRAGEPRRENTNRQIVSTVGGLRRVTTKYAMKLRADNYLTGTGFKSLQEAYPRRCDAWRLLRERVVVTNILSRRFYRGRRVVFFLSDFFDFGLTEDVLDIWDQPLLTEYPFDPGLLGALQHHGAPAATIDVNQVLALGFVNKSRSPKIALRDIFDVDDDKPRQSDLFFANNFVVATAEEVGLGIPLKFTTGRQAKFSSRATCLATAEWQGLYRTHCDPDYRPTADPRLLLTIRLMRALAVPLKRVESLSRELREARRHRRARRRGRGATGA